MKIKLRTLYKPYTEYNEHDNKYYQYGYQWVVQEKGWLFWHDINKFKSHEQAIKYMNDYKKRKELENTVFYPIESDQQNPLE